MVFLKYTSRCDCNCNIYWPPCSLTWNVHLMCVYFHCFKNLHHQWFDALRKEYGIEQKKKALLALSVNTEHHINNSASSACVDWVFWASCISGFWCFFYLFIYFKRTSSDSCVCVWPVSSTRLLLQIGVCVECRCCVQTTEELLFVQPRYGGSRTGKNNSPALHPAPLLSPQSRASVRARARASCPALIFWTGLARTLPARLAWRCPPTWNLCRSGQRGSRETVVGYFSALSPGRHLHSFLCHASSISLSNLVFNLPVYHSGTHTRTHTHTHTYITGRR